ncbi:hypothetical protein PESHB5_01900 [Pediococcus parvulus]
MENLSNCLLAIGTSHYYMNILGIVTENQAKKVEKSKKFCIFLKVPKII